MKVKVNEMNKAIEHTQLEGMAFFHKEDLRTLLFSPDNPIPGITESFRSRGVAQQMSDGTFDFVRLQRKRYKTELVGKCAHGRVSKLHGGAIRLTLTFSPEEHIHITSALQKEMFEAIDHIKNFQDREFLDKLKNQK